MAREFSTVQWCRHLEVSSGEQAIGELGRFLRDLDGAWDTVNRVSKALWGAPDGDVGDSLLVARTTLNEAATRLDFVISGLRHAEDLRRASGGGPDAA